MLLTLMLVPQNVWAWGGSGTASSPYTISSAADLLKFANIVNGANGETKNISACAKLTADITLSGTWKPIGNSSGHYKGTFDGQGHKISGFSITGYTAVNSGFFGYMEGATIKNFTLSGTMSSATQITGGENDCSGAVVARAIGASTIQDIVSSVNWTLTKAQKHLGGVVGQIDGSTTVARCTYSGTLDAGPTTDCVGGIVGFATASCSGSITNCCFSGTLKSSSSTPTLGGILGYTNDESSNFGGVQLCFSHGTFSFGTSDYKYVNAIVGRIRNRATTTINNFYLSTTASRACNTDGPSIPTSNKAATLDECKSGAITWALNNPGKSFDVSEWRIDVNNMEGTEERYFKNFNAQNRIPWRQTLETDAFPTLIQSHGEVYQVPGVTCQVLTLESAPYYSNEQTVHTIHDTAYKDKVEPTCVQRGSVRQYYCWRCELSFEDAEGKHVIFTPNIEPLGHDFSRDKNYCDRCKHYLIHYKCSYGRIDPDWGLNYKPEWSTFNYGTYEGVLAFENAPTAIPAQAFSHTNINSISIPNTATSIGNFAFFNCKHFEEDIVIPNSVTSIGNGAFKGCLSDNNKIVLSTSLKTIGSEAFYGSSFAGNWVIPNSVTSIGENAFAYANFNGTLTLGSSLATIGYRAFYNSGFTGNLVIPNTVTSIGDQAFANAAFNGTLALGSSLKTIGTEAFNGCGFKGNLVIPNSVEKIYRNAFENCNFTGKLVLGNSLNVLYDAAFKNSGFTGDLVIPNSLSTIYYEAFSGCKFNGNLTIGNSVSRIEDNAFHNCGFKGKLTVGTKILDRLSSSIFIGSSFSEVELHSLPRFIGSDSNYANPFPNVDNINLIIEDNSHINTYSDFPELKSVCYIRNMSADSQWGSLVLPFNTVSNDDVQLYMLKDVRNQQMILTPVESVERSTPCIFKKKNESATSITFTGDGFDNTFNSRVDVSDPNSRWSFEGFYEDITRRNCYFIAQNKFWYADDPVTIKRFRVAYYINDIDTAAAKSLGIVVDDDATGVKDINAAKGMQSGKFLEGGQIVIVKNGKKYNANGQEVK